MGKGLRALVVDDEQSVRAVCTMLLQDLAFDVVGASSVAEAAAAIEDQTFDLVFADKNLPDGDGMEVGKLLRNRDEDAALMLITAYPNVESAIEALHLGVDDFLEKPFTDLEFIVQRIGRAIHGVRLKRENANLVGELRRRNAELEEAALRDSLTHLYNHAFFQESLRREVERCTRSGGEVGLLFVDFDDFKSVNHSKGHPSGDSLLKEFADMLQGESRAADLHFRMNDKDFAARYGGDEFALVLPDTNRVGAIAKAEKLRTAVESASFGGVPLQTISVGVSCFPNDGDSAEALVDAADRALYAAKKAGRNCIMAYDEAMSPRRGVLAQAAAERRLRSALDTAIVDENFGYVHQPILSATGDVFAFEALCRPKGKAFPHPGVLFDAAERFARIKPLGRVLRNLSIQAVERLPKESYLFINLHPHELSDPELGSEREDLVRWADRVVFEITESAAIKDHKRFRQTLDGLREKGFRIALDDLGAGYSGLNSLAMLRPNFVKLDMALVRSIGTEPGTARLVQHIVEFASDEGMQVVAEGIETEEQRQSVVDLGCHLLQGFLFSAGRPVEEIEGGKLETFWPAPRIAKA